MNGEKICGYQNESLKPIFNNNKEGFLYKVKKKFAIKGIKPINNNKINNKRI